jgi:NADPH-dependent glutamate synthase beta subunit-like oxidoreductase
MLERCRGEGPANCVGRCPLNIDARQYVQLTKQGRYRDALQVVRDKLPFPGVLGYVCAHPCELHCKRLDEDTPIRIRDIKRFLADWEPGEPQHILTCAPDRGQRVAVVGAGPAGLLAAHDLRRQGYQVTVFERSDRIGGCLTHQIPSWRLPTAVAQRDLSIIDALGIEVRTGADVGTTVTLDDLRRDFAAVLVLTGYAGALALLEQSMGFVPGPRETIGVDPETGETGLPGVFAGGDAVSGPSTVIYALAQGRRVAESAHRFLTGADLRADRPGVLPGRLLWGLDVDDAERRRRVRTPVMLQPHTPAMSEAEARAEAERCLDCECGLCVKDCEFLAKHCRSPKDLARRVLAGLDPIDTRSMAYSCNICELCATVCPEKLDTGHMLLEARRESVRRGLGPLKQHKPIVGYWKAGVSGTFTLAMAEPGRRKSKRLFFTGCSLPATAPGHTMRVYDELRRHYPGTGVLMWCCGAPADLLGLEDGFASTRQQLLRAAEQCGADELVVACPDCLHTLRSAVPELTLSTVWERLAPVWKTPATREGVVVSIHDSCKGRHDDGLHVAVRHLIQESGATVNDVEYHGRKARCCGFGGMIYPVDPPLSKKISQRRADESPLPMVTYCAGCRTALASMGKESLHILDLLLTDNWQQAATRKPVGAIPRYLNRLRTKWAFKRLQPLAVEKE